MKRMSAAHAQDRRAVHAATLAVTLAVTRAAILAEKTIATAADTTEDLSREDNPKYGRRLFFLESEIFLNPEFFTYCIL